MSLPSIIGKPRLDVVAEWAEMAPFNGVFLEVGVYKGGSAQRLYEIARQRGQRLWLYDTFTGIPHADPAIDRHSIGDFADVDLDTIRTALPRAVIRAGVFPHSLDPTMGTVAFAHLDCDQYLSYREAIRALLPLLAQRAIMVFDDYAFLPGAQAAVDEMLPGMIYRNGETAIYVHRKA